MIEKRVEGRDKKLWVGGKVRQECVRENGRVKPINALRMASVAAKAELP